MPKVWATSASQLLHAMNRREYCNLVDALHTAVCSQCDPTKKITLWFSTWSLTNERRNVPLPATEDPTFVTKHICALWKSLQTGKFPDATFDAPPFGAAAFAFGAAAPPFGAPPFGGGGAPSSSLSGVAAPAFGASAPFAVCAPSPSPLVAEDAPAVPPAPPIVPALSIAPSSRAYHPHKGKRGEGWFDCNSVELQLIVRVSPTSALSRLALSHLGPLT